jgi:solute carrier family 39 (zinc transporter), member 1/2/3
MNLLWIKLFSLFIIFITGLITGLAPLRLSTSEKRKRQLTWGNAFAGGIFLGAGLLHMLPDAFENFKIVAGGIDFPFPALICGLGFLLVLLLEKAVLKGSEDVGKMSGKRTFYPFLLCLVLSVHSIIAGTSLGLETAKISVTAIFIAIIVHKGAAAFALGVSLKDSDIPSSRFKAIIVFFATMTPLGVVLGTIFTALFSGRTIIFFEAIFDSLAAGTFIYVAVVDIIEEVFEHSQDRWIKSLLLWTGFGLMALIAIWT